MANPARAYLATQVETTTQGELLIMLYEAAIKFLKRANIEIDNKNYAKKGIYISKAMAIIHELAESLNREKGGEITPKLLQLYMFCTSQLIKANIRLDKKMISDVISILEGLHSAYAQIVPQQEGKGAAQVNMTKTPTPPPAMQPAANAPDSNSAAAQQPPAQSQPAGYGKPNSMVGGLFGKKQAPANPQQSANSATETPPAPQPAAPQTPPPMPAAEPQAAVPAQQQAAAAPQPETTAQPQAPAQTEQAQPQPAPPAPPKLRNGFNAAKFRAANAYTNNT